MSDIENLFLAAYPLWPRALLEKFSSLLSLEVARFNPEINIDIVKKFDSLNTSISLEVNGTGNVFYLLPNSPPEMYAGQSYFDNYFSVIHGANRWPGQDGGDWYNYPNAYDQAHTENISGKIIFDKRLYKSVVISVSMYYTYSGAMRNGLMNMILGIAARYPLSAKAEKEKFQGANTVLGMIENGIMVDVNKSLLVEFCTFINSYTKYSNQLAAQKSVLTEKISQELTSVKNLAIQNIREQTADLRNMKTQIVFAAQVSSDSAKRDMQQLSLAAQSLMIQLQGKMA